MQPRALAHWLWGHELLTFQGEATETYTKWAALVGPFFRVKGALFHPDIVSARLCPPWMLSGFLLAYTACVCALPTCERSTISLMW